MKIDKIIFAVDDNPKYQGLWEVNSEICKKVLGITPILFYITDEDSDFFEDEYGLVKKVKKLPTHNSAFQSQVYRMYGTKYFPDEVCIISDIDMLIVNKSYIIDQVKDFNDEDFIIYISDAYDNKREECVGIYSEPRIPMCYNAAKGKTFNDILNTFRSFDQFLDEVISVCESEHDRDEIFLGKKIQSYYNQNKIKKLIRGYETPFVCHKRNDRPVDESFFNNYNEEDIFNGNIIDIHLSRPYIKHKKQIDKLKKNILNEDNEIYLIGCHIESEIQERYLRELTSDLIKNNKKFVLTSHTIIPSDIIEKSVGYIYDSINPKFKTWELDSFPKFVFENDFFKIESPYISHGASNYYHVGVIRLIINGLRFLQKTKYKIVHWIEYDALPNYSTNNSCKNELDEYDFIFFGVGSKFTFKLNKVNSDFLNMDDFQIMIELQNNSYLAEKLISEKLISGIKKTYYMDETETNSWGRYSQNFNLRKINWSLFDDDGVIKIFIHNISNDTQKLSLKIVDKIVEYELHPYNWIIRDVIEKKNLGYFSILNGDEVIVDTILSNKENYDNIIGKVNFVKK